MTLESSPDRTIDNSLLYDADELLNFAADSEEGTVGSCHVAPSVVGENDGAVEQVTFEDANALDDASDNGDRDRLYNKEMLDLIGYFEDEESSEGADVAVVEDKAQSWRINHSRGDHKLRRKLGRAAPHK